MEHTNDIETTPEQSPRCLTVVYVHGRPYFRDLRLGELRACDNPHERRPLGIEDLFGDD
ncbi:MAG: hypothetical protein ABR961_14460 [Thermoanaerobaculaceae bacterium]|jgi:hypothetical protein